MALSGLCDNIQNIMAQRGIYLITQIEEIISGVALDESDKIILLSVPNIYGTYASNVPNSMDMLYYTTGILYNDKIHCTEIHNDQYFDYSIDIKEIPDDILVTNKVELCCLKYICVLLHNAVRDGNILQVSDILNQLTQKQKRLILNMHVHNSLGGTALHMAMRNYHPITCECTEKVNCTVIYKTPNRQEITELLMHAGADPLKKNYASMTVYAYAHLSKLDTPKSNRSTEAFNVLGSEVCKTS